MLYAETPEEIEARKFGLSYIKLSGNIGCLVNGAGLAMATMDIIQHKGGKPANFLDIGGGASAEKVSAALRIILGDPQVKTVLINIFGGITRCDEVASGIRHVLERIKTELPFIIRLVGTNETEGKKILADANLQTADSLQDAAEKAVKFSLEKVP
jgi:succinyl-CoA synthetase beta subunit